MRSSHWMLPSLLCLIWLTPALSQAAVPSLQQPNAYAVVIGISQYREEVIPKVPYAVKDAEAIAQLLEKQAGIPKTHIRLLTDAKATSADLRTIGDWLKMRVKPESTIYIYYAGHGTPNPKTGEAYLVPWDGNPDYPAGLYPLNDLYATLNKLPAKDIVVLLDSCFSGAQGRSVLAKGARPMVISAENPLLASGKVIVLAASTGSQISSDYDKAGHGLFTHAVLTGLHGAADQDQNGLVTLRELFPYVRDQVATTAVDELNREQTPVLLLGEESLGARSALPIALVVPGAPEAPKAATALSQAEQELKALEAQERAVDEQAKQATLQRQIEEKKRQIEEKKKQLEVASLPSYSAPKETGREITGKDGAPMVLVLAGEFIYGHGEKTTQQKASVDAFYMDLYEVTTGRYAQFMQATGRGKPDYWSEVRPVSDGELPVVGVEWDEANAYCQWAGKRLPTDQEWEKAARGTDGRAYPWGNTVPTAGLANYDHSLANADRSGCSLFCNVYAEKLKPVNSYKGGRSPYGIYNMAGNVWEWVEEKVLRGGSWADFASDLQSAGQLNFGPAPRDSSIGFRCAKTP
nr:SUMF1/EgtB/PvdO family nonheme iron enzyme [Nitrospirota bacterium]